VKATPDNLPPPLTPQERLLRNIVIGLGILFVAGLAALAGAIIMKKPAHDVPTAQGRWATPLMAQVPPGSDVQKMALDGTRLIVHVRHADGTGEMLIFDLRKKQLTGRILLNSP